MDALFFTAETDSATDFFVIAIAISYLCFPSLVTCLVHGLDGLGRHANLVEFVSRLASLRLVW